MSKLDRYYFKWDEKRTNLDIKLNDSKETLIANGLVTQTGNPDTYKSSIDPACEVKFMNDKVAMIVFNLESSFQLAGVKICGEEYAKIKTHLESKFESLGIEEGNHEANIPKVNTDLLFILCRDFFVSMIVIRKKDEVG